jgi:hypothetical protein
MMIPNNVRQEIKLWETLTQANIPIDQIEEEYNGGLGWVSEPES